MTLDANGVVIAAITFGAIVGTWSAVVTMQIRGLRREVREMHDALDAIVKWYSSLGFTLPEGLRARDRYSRKLLDTRAPRVR